MFEEGPHHKRETANLTVEMPQEMELIRYAAENLNKCSQSAQKDEGR